MKRVFTVFLQIIKTFFVINIIKRLRALLFIKKQATILLYLGTHRGQTLLPWIKHYDRVYAFEANPELVKKLKVFRLFPHVKIINAAVHDTHNKVIPFYISKNGGQSSSILEVNEKNKIADYIKAVKKISVKTVNLAEFLKENKIDYIDHYISDLQGMDLRVLQTLKPYIDAKAIGRIQVETMRDGRESTYKDTNNYESDFRKLFNGNYEKISHGYHSLKDGVFMDVDNEYDEYDVCWIATPKK